jgi:hypothetical protein
MFVVFPSIGIFISSLTIFRIFDFPLKWTRKLVLSILLTGMFAIYMTLNSEKYFNFLYALNFISIIIIVPGLTYLSSFLIPRFMSKKYWLRHFILFLFSTIFTLLIFGVLFFISMASNAYIPK